MTCVAGNRKGCRARHRRVEPGARTRLPGCSRLVLTIPCEPGLQRHTQAVGDTIYVCVVSDDLHDVEDVAIGEAGTAHGGHVSFSHVAGGRRQILGLGQHRHPFLTEAGGTPVGFDALDQIVVLEKRAQTAPVVPHSVVTVVVGADDEGDQFPFDLSQRLRARHRGFVEGLVGDEGSPVEGMDLHDVVDPSRFSVDDLVVEVRKRPFPFIFSDRLYPGHGLTPFIGSRHHT